MRSTPLDGPVSGDLIDSLRNPRICFDWEDLHYFVTFSAIKSLREGLKKPFLQKSKPVNTGAPARFLSKKMGFFRGY
ncbi:hypothetical protein F4W70_04415 [Pseudomonas cannabina]|nr:hypothetical protein F4W70_04415 [Pseudomonas cannabina]SDQ81328.1 hypothetical protein SAMN05216597_1327 [Pseudomonas cannabina]